MTEPSIESALLELTAARHRIRPAAAAKLLNVTRMRITRATERLRAEGLIDTEPHPGDARSCLLLLTSEGESRAMGMRIRAGCSSGVEPCSAS